MVFTSTAPEIKIELEISLPFTSTAVAPGSINALPTSIVIGLSPSKVIEFSITVKYPTSIGGVEVF